MKVKGKAGRTKDFRVELATDVGLAGEIMDLVWARRQAERDHEEKPLLVPGMHPQTNGKPLKRCQGRSDTVVFPF